MREPRYRFGLAGNDAFNEQMEKHRREILRKQETTEETIIEKSIINKNLKGKRKLRLKDMPKIESLKKWLR
ncbi:MAG: hypothetical protein ACFFDN_01335 [Candidatus Hodarchaeota archaeon]